MHASISNMELIVSEWNSLDHKNNVKSCNNFLQVETLHSKEKVMILEVLKKNFIKKFIKKNLINLKESLKLSWGTNALHSQGYRKKRTAKETQTSRGVWKRLWLGELPARCAESSSVGVSVSYLCLGRLWSLSCLWSCLCPCTYLSLIFLEVIPINALDPRERCQATESRSISLSD